MHKKYEELTFTDDFMFAKVLNSNTEITRRLLQLILGKEISRVENADTQHSITPRYDRKGVRFDVYAQDEIGSVYDIEMQVCYDAGLPLRSRYYHSMIDLNQLERGKSYRTLNDTYVIFICVGPIGENYTLPIYTYKSICVEDRDAMLNDGRTTVLVNPHCDMSGIDPGLRAFLEYIRDGRREEKDDLVEQIDKLVATAREHRRWEVEYMTLEEKLADEREAGYFEGVREGIYKGSIKTLISLVKSGAITTSQAANTSKMSEEDFVKLLKDESTKKQ